MPFAVLLALDLPADGAIGLLVRYRGDPDPLVRGIVVGGADLDALGADLDLTCLGRAAPAAGPVVGAGVVRVLDLRGHREVVVGGPPGLGELVVTTLLVVPVAVVRAEDDLPVALG